MTRMARLPAVLALALLAGGVAHGQTPSTSRPAETAPGRIEMNQVSPHLLAAARQVGELTEITVVGVEVEGARVIWEIRGRTRDGRIREVDFLSSGELDEVETEIQQTDVPQPVMQTLQRWMPNFRPTKFERSERPANGVPGVTYVVFEFEGQFGVVEVDVEVSADGSRLMVVDDSRN